MWTHGSDGTWLRIFAHPDDDALPLFRGRNFAIAADDRFIYVAQEPTSDAGYPSTLQVFDYNWQRVSESKPFVYNVASLAVSSLCEVFAGQVNYRLDKEAAYNSVLVFDCERKATITRQISATTAAGKAFVGLSRWRLIVTTICF